MTPMSSWGRLTSDLHDVIRLPDPASVRRCIEEAPLPGIAYGMGRSYGDVCLNPGGVLWHTVGLDHLVRFDEESGLLTCEAGVQLVDIQRMAVPRGWMLPVTPGTQLVTVGGAIANDVHGKNHHAAGSFGDHVRRIRLIRTDGSTVDCGPRQQAEWFAATVGGLGLTGVIIEVDIQLRRTPGPWLDSETIPYAGLDEFFRLADESESAWEYTVSWIDCLAGGAGRGLFMRGNPVEVSGRSVPADRKKTMPFVPPVSLVNRFTLPPFNVAYYHLIKLAAGRAVVHYESYLYPLDNLLHWNRMYGPKGFYQYQSVVPRENGEDAVAAMLREIRRSGDGSFLAVLKTFGDRNAVGMMSFPRPGVTLALDFPNHGIRIHRLFDRLDAIVREADGRLYAAKDSRMPRALFESGYPRLSEFLKFRDPGISSAMSRRLMGS